MFWILCLAVLMSPQTAASAAIDVSTLTIGAPHIVAEIDTGKLKGEIRQLAWSPDATAIYLQTVDGDWPNERQHHYTIPVTGGGVTTLEAQPEWAVAYWRAKQDRVAPGLPALVIDIEQKQEVVKGGVGGGAGSGMLDRESSPEKVVASGSPRADSMASGNMGNDKAKVVRLMLLGEEVAVWANERVVPGARFGWGPAGSGALVRVGEGGRLVFLDRQKHSVPIIEVKDASWPAWSSQGSQVAYLQKVSRKRFVLMCVPVTR
ncbi:MAG TPA: hypothetical protein VGK32_21285 [Vicinamibacterales bacterium]|jgi:hypothetical protein